MRIGIDCRLAGSKHAGIGRYIENLVRRLPAELADTNGSLVYFFYDQAQADQVLTGVDLQGVEVVLAPVRHYSIMEQLKMPGIFQAARLDLLHVPHFNVPLFYSGQLVITIHDLLWHQRQGTRVTTLPSWQYWVKYQAYKMVAASAISRAVQIMVPAQTIKQTLGSYYPGALHKVTVTPEGIADSFSQQPTVTDRAQQYLDKYKVDAKTLVYVGSMYPHKNLKLVMTALTKLPQHQLLLIGSRNVFQDQMKKLSQQQGLQDRVSFLGYVEDQDLVGIYGQAGALIQPSLSEGFGLTGVEAMASGLPVLASRIPIFEEVYGPAALMFDPHDPQSLIEAITKLPDERAKLIKHGRSHVKKYSWSKMVSKTLAIYQNLLPNVR